ncbi:hypothetical protein V6N13_012420 [Hibiscus sabdariffa]|uniref:Uncharacterized protein n=1 Tax=Hibiscus sabdariffa TaxID=183260 RepID=A0ABR2SFY8_9ROSI
MNASSILDFEASADLARPRLVKIRKQLNSNNLKSSDSLETRVGPGFNRFRPVSSVPGTIPSYGSNLSGNLDFRGRSCGGNEEFENREELWFRLSKFSFEAS